MLGANVRGGILCVTYDGCKWVGLVDSRLARGDRL